MTADAGAGSRIAASDEGVPATWSRARRAAASPFPARLATSKPRSTIATFDDAPRAPSPVPTMTADAGAGSRIAASDDEIHSLTLEGPSCGGFSRPAPREPAMSCCASSQAAEPPVSPLAGFQRLPVAHRAGGPRRWASRPWRAFLARFRGLPCPAPPARPLWTVPGQVGRLPPARP